MKYRLLDLLKPLEGEGWLRVENARTKTVEISDPIRDVPCRHFCGLRNGLIANEKVSPSDCAACFREEIMEGELVSDSGKRYSIAAGIPRILSDDTADWVKRNQDTFSLEWKLFRFGERNWGQDIEFRKELFLKGMGVDAEALQGKLIFDAGCGSGVLSMELAASFGMEVIALDLAFGIEQAYEQNSNPHVHFIQGSVLQPPIRHQTMDHVYCAGVLVHIPEPREGFAMLRSCLKPGGRCFIWVYHPVDDEHYTPREKRKLQVYHWLRKNVTLRLPIKIQYALYLSLMPAFLVKQKVTNPFREEKDDRTWREKMQSFVDFFSVTYHHMFTEEEIQDWFSDSGFLDVRIPYREVNGFSARGDLPRSERSPRQG